MTISAMGSMTRRAVMAAIPVTATARKPCSPILGRWRSPCRTQEIRYLTVEAIAPATRAVTLRGRPQPTPLDPWTQAAIRACLAHRHALRSANPYLIVTLQTKATRAPSGDSYVKNILAPAGIRPRVLRSSRILSLVSTADPKLVATAYGMTYDAVTAYLADRVDPTRLPTRDLQAAPCT